MGYRWECDIILLVGLTELKAQVSWIDPETIRARLVLPYKFTSSEFHMGESRGQKRFVVTFSEFIPKLNPAFRSDAVVIYNDRLQNV